MDVALTPEGWAKVAALTFHAKCPETRAHQLLVLESALIPLFTKAMEQARTTQGEPHENPASGS